MYIGLGGGGLLVVLSRGGGWVGLVQGGGGSCPGRGGSGGGVGSCPGGGGRSGLPLITAPLPPFSDRMTDACENITFATRAVIKKI